MTCGRRKRGALVAALLALAPANARAGGDGSQRIAVLAASSGVPESAAAAMVSAAVEAVREAGADPVSPDDVARAVLAARGDVATCAKNAACAADACSAVWADALLASSMRDVGSGWLIEVRLRERRGGLRGQDVAVVARNDRAAREAAARLARQMVDKLTATGVLAATTNRPSSPARAAPSAATPAGTRPQAGPGSERKAADVSAEPHERAGVATDSNATPSVPRLAPDARLTKGERGSGAAPSSRRRWGVVLALGGAALLAGGASAGAFAWDRSRGANALLAAGDLDGWAIGNGESRTLAWTAAGLGGAGAAALAAGAWLWLGGRSASVSLRLEPGGADARLALAF